MPASWGKQPLTHRSDMVNKLETSIPILQICYGQWVAEQVFRIKIENRRSNSKRHPRSTARSEGGTPTSLASTRFSTAAAVENAVENVADDVVNETPDSYQSRATPTDDGAFTGALATPPPRRPGRPPKQGKQMKGKQMKGRQAKGKQTKEKPNPRSPLVAMPADPSPSPVHTSQHSGRKRHQLPWEIPDRAHPQEDDDSEAGSEGSGWGTPNEYDDDGQPVWITGFSRTPRNRCRRPTVAQMEAWEERKATLERRRAQAKKAMERTEKLLEKEAAERRLAGRPSPKHWTEISDAEVDSPPRKKKKTSIDLSVAKAGKKDAASSQPTSLYRKINGKFILATSQ